ncbi:MAG TPA: ABC transporter permease, partial [Bacillota bacterium]|nr:ABC transporter permease [Bacillota bacterium]
MFDAHELFKKRFSNHLKEMGRYTKYMFNGHMAVALFFFIAAFAYYYQSWLQDLPEDFPTGIIIGIAFGLLLSYNPVSTLLKEPDLFFLIAAEKKMGPYFRNALIYSYVVQLYLVFLLFAVFGPLYFASYPSRDPKMYLLILLVVLVFKAWNLYANWSILKTRDPVLRGLDVLVRGILNIGVGYFLIVGNIWWASVCTLVFMAVFIYDIYTARKKNGIVWDLLVEKDIHRMQAFYRLANMFTDVGHLKNRVKKRRWLSGLIYRIPFVQKYTYRFLFRITFIRSGDYL